MRLVTDGRLVVFGPQHLLLLGVFALGCAASLLLGALLRSRPRAITGVLAAAGVGIAVCCAPFEAYDLIVGLAHPRTSLPLQICDLAWVVAAIGLLTRRPRWLALLYFWGLTLCLQGVVTPDLDHVFPAWQFFGFWLRHLLPVWAAVLLVAMRRGPTWRGYRFSIAVTAAWAALVISLNTAFGSNYGYLNGKPASGSVLNLLGPWPWYVLVEVLLVSAVWALITWPWNRRARSRQV